MKKFYFILLIFAFFAITNPVLATTCYLEDFTAGTCSSTECTTGEAVADSECLPDEFCCPNPTTPSGTTTTTTPAPTPPTATAVTAPATVTPAPTVKTESTSYPLPNPVNTTDIMAIIKNAITVGLSFLGGATLLMVIYGGFLWLTSGGDKKKIDQGKNTLIWAILGIFVILASYAILSYVFTELTKTL